MNLRHTSAGLALLAVLGASAAAQDVKTASQGEPPRIRVQVFGDAVIADFSTRISAYADLRAELMKGLPVLAVNDPAAVQDAVHALAARIRVARSKARRGDIFTPSISRAFKKALVLQMDDRTRAALADDNPGDFAKRINGSYPEDKPFSTVPANILSALPPLPDQIEYRFLGRHLILLDTDAGVIVDWIPFSIQCPDPNDKSSCHR